MTLCILRVVKPTTSISLPRGCYRFPLACALRKSRLYFLLIPALWHLKKQQQQKKKNVKEVQFKKKSLFKGTDEREVKHSTAKELENDYVPLNSS